MKYRQGFSCEGAVRQSDWNGAPEKNMTLVTYDASTGYCVQLDLNANKVANLVDK
jgi:hypothetical protein